MDRKFLALAFLVWFEAPAQAIIGGAPVATGELARSVIGIVGSHHEFCTATRIARDLLLTAAHCLQPGLLYKAQHFGSGTRELFDIISLARPPQFTGEMTPTTPPVADLAIAKVANPLPEDIAVAILGLNEPPAWPGDRFVVIGEGIALPGLHSTGLNRAASLVAIAPYNTLQLRLVDSSGKQASVGACPGDSGAPVFQARSEGAKLIAVVSWASGPKGSKGCGGITGATLLAPYRQWIEDVEKRLASESANGEQTK